MESLVTLWCEVHSVVCCNLISAAQVYTSESSEFERKVVAGADCHCLEVGR